MARLTGRFRSRWTRLDEQELHYLRSTGPAPPYPTPVILIHGIMSGASFVPVGELIAPWFRVFIPDMPGIGGSEPPVKTPELSDLVDSLIRWMDRCGITQAHLAGQSFGCNLAVETAVTHPSRVASLTLQALTLEPGRRKLSQLARHWLLAELREIPKTRAKKQGQKGVSTKGNRALLKALLGHRIEERLPLVPCPALVLHGSHDFIVSRRWIEQAVHLLPDVRLTVIPRGTHTMNARQPEIFADTFLDFVSDLPLNAPVGPARAA